jgi:hypothetical protein
MANKNPKQKPELTVIPGDPDLEEIAGLFEALKGRELTFGRKGATEAGDGKGRPGGAEPYCVAAPLPGRRRWCVGR